MADIKKTATYGEYVINIASDNSVTVLKNGNVCKVAKDALRKIATYIKFDVDEKWTTRQLGAKLVVVISNKSLKQDADKALKAYDKMQGYKIQEDLLKELLKCYPDHKNKFAVETKVKLLNLFYSTGIQATNVMAQNILSIKDIDERLADKDFSLVGEIAKLTFSNNNTRNNYSFATKYCAYHQPKLFPIYDSIVAKTFVSLFEKGLLPKYTYSRKSNQDTNTFSKVDFSDRLKDYNFYVDIYDYFMDLYDLKTFTYREIDSYIWGAFKIGGVEFEIEKMADLDKSKIVEVEISDDFSK